MINQGHVHCSLRLSGYRQGASIISNWEITAMAKNQVTVASESRQILLSADQVAKIRAGISDEAQVRQALLDCEAVINERWGINADAQTEYLDFKALLFTAHKDA
jgi:hypothetical protein